MSLSKFLLSISTIMLVTGCASTKAYREPQKSTEQNTLDNTSFVRVINNTNDKINISYNSIPELTDPNKTNITTFSPGNQNPTTFPMGLAYSIASINTKEDKLIKIRKNDSIKIKYKKNNQEMEQELKIRNDSKLEVTEKGINYSKMLK